jgi:RNA-dependent RNA polymerase
LDEEKMLSVEKRLLNSHSGKVYFRAHLEYDNGRIRIVLESPIIGGSRRILRKYGSESMILVSIPDQINKINIKAFFKGVEFILLGRRFGMAAVRDNSVVLLSNPASPTGSPIDAIFEFWNWHNPLQENQDQSKQKWIARLDLCFSSTVPCVQLKPTQLKSIGDFGKTRHHL